MYIFALNFEHTRYAKRYEQRIGECENEKIPLFYKFFILKKFYNNIFSITENSHKADRLAFVEVFGYRKKYYCIIFVV